MHGNDPSLRDFGLVEDAIRMRSGQPEFVGLSGGLIL